MTPAEKFAAAKRRGKTIRRNPQATRMVCNLAALRNSLGLTPTEVSSQTGIARSTLSEMEKGRAPTLTVAITIARFFGVSLEQMWPAATVITPPKETR